MRLLAHGQMVRVLAWQPWDTSSDLTIVDMSSWSYLPGDTKPICGTVENDTIDWPKISEWWNYSEVIDSCVIKKSQVIVTEILSCQFMYYLQKL